MDRFVPSPPTSGRPTRVLSSCNGRGPTAVERSASPLVVVPHHQTPEPTSGSDRESEDEEETLISQISISGDEDVVDYDDDDWEIDSDEEFPDSGSEDIEVHGSTESEPEGSTGSSTYSREMAVPVIVQDTGPVDLHSIIRQSTPGQRSPARKITFDPLPPSEMAVPIIKGERIHRPMSHPPIEETVVNKVVNKTINDLQELLNNACGMSMSDWDLDDEPIRYTEKLTAKQTTEKNTAFSTNASKQELTTTDERVAIPAKKPDVIITGSETMAIDKKQQEKECVASRGDAKCDIGQGAEEESINKRSSTVAESDTQVTHDVIRDITADGDIARIVPESKAISPPPTVETICIIDNSSTIDATGIFTQSTTTGESKNIMSIATTATKSSILTTQTSTTTEVAQPVEQSTASDVNIQIGATFEPQMTSKLILDDHGAEPLLNTIVSVMEAPLASQVCNVSSRSSSSSSLSGEGYRPDEEDDTSTSSNQGKDKKIKRVVKRSARHHDIKDMPTFYPPKQKRRKPRPKTSTRVVADQSVIEENAQMSKAPSSMAETIIHTACSRDVAPNPLDKSRISWSSQYDPPALWASNCHVVPGSRSSSQCSVPGSWSSSQYYITGSRSSSPSDMSGSLSSSKCRVARSSIDRVRRYSDKFEYINENDVEAPEQDVLIDVPSLATGHTHMPRSGKIRRVLKGIRNVFLGCFGCCASRQCDN